MFQAPTTRQTRWWLLVVGVVLLALSLLVPLIVTHGYPGLSFWGVAIVLFVLVGLGFVARFLLDIISSRDHRAGRPQI